MVEAPGRSESNVVDDIDGTGWRGVFVRFARTLVLVNIGIALVTMVMHDSPHSVGGPLPVAPREAEETTVDSAAGDTTAPGDTTGGETTAADDTPAPGAPDPRRDQLRRIAVDLLELRNDVYQNPEPGRVPDYAYPGCSCYRPDHEEIGRMAARGARWTTPPYTLLGVVVADDAGEHSAVEVVVNVNQGQMVDADGTVVIDQRPGAGERQYLAIALGNVPGSGWRVVDVAQPPGVGQDDIDRVIGAGLP